MKLLAMHEDATLATPMAATSKPKSRGVESDRLRIEVLRSYEDMLAIEPVWTELEARTAPSGAFQSYAHSLIWARNFVRDDDGRLCVVMLYQDDRLSLILPLFVFKRFGTAIAEVIGSPIAEYAEAMTDGSALGPKQFEALVDVLRKEGVDELNLEGVRNDSVLFRLAETFHLAPRNCRVAPFVDLSEFPDHDSFVRSRFKGFGKKMRARRRQLEEKGELKMELIEGGPEARKAMSSALDLKREWLIQRGAMSTAFLDPISGACLLDLAESAPGALVLMMLLNGVTAAIRLGFVHRGTFFSYLSAYDQSLASYSPGKLLMDFTLSSLRDRGISKIDLLPPFSDNKAGWTDRSEEVADYLLPLSWKGRLHAGLYQQRLRPILRSGYYKLPDGVRRAVARRLIAS